MNPLFLLDGKPSVRQAFPLAAQHVIAMVVGCVAPAIMIGQIAIENGSMQPEDMTMLIQATLIISGAATLLQLLSLNHRIGSGLPVIMGVSFAYLASLQAIAARFDLATLFGAQLAGALACVAVGILLSNYVFYFRRWWPVRLYLSLVFHCIRQPLIIWPAVLAVMIMAVGRIGLWLW